MRPGPERAAPGAGGPFLAVNIGNTRTSLGLWAPPAPLATTALATTPLRTPEECAVLVRAWLTGARGGGRPAPASVAIASVVPPRTALWREAAALLGVDPAATRVYGEDGALGIEVRLDMPAAGVGADRLLNAIAARALLGAPALVVDIGTALTLDVVAGDGAFIGGAIAPGPVTAAAGLWRRAPGLATVDVAVPERAVGRRTDEALQAGIALGAAGQIEALVGAARAELGAPAAPVVATGGLAQALAAATPTVDRVDPWLTLRGLRRWALGVGYGQA